MPKQRSARDHSSEKSNSGQANGGKKLQHLHEEVREKDLLLSLANDIVSVGEKKDILRIIHPKLKTLFNTEDIFICRLNRQQQTIEPFLRVFHEDRLHHEGCEALLAQSFSLDDRFIHTIAHAKEPVVSDLEEWCGEPMSPRYLQTLRAAGIAESLSVCLHQANETIGVFTLWSDRKGFFNEHHRELIQVIADQVSLVVTTIADNESLRQKERESEILLSISNQVAAIRNREGLEHLLSASLRDYLPYSDGVIVVYNKEKNIYKAYASYIDEKRRTHPAIRMAMEAEYPLADNSLANPHQPLVVDIEQVIAAGKTQASFVQSAGIAEMAIIKLVDGEQLIGLFVLMSETKGNFSASSLSIMQRSSYAISIAVAKLRALEEIQAREKEKEVSLSISEAIASIRDKKDLIYAIQQTLKTCFRYSDIAITRFNLARGSYRVFLEYCEKTSLHPAFDQIAFNEYPIADGLHDTMMNSEHPVLFTVESLRHPDRPHIEFLHQAGIRELGGIRLQHNGETIGTMLLLSEEDNSFTPGNLRILEDISRHFSIAMLNIIYLEEIEQRNREIANQLVEISRYKEQLEEEKLYLQEQVRSGYTYSDIIGVSQPMQEVFHLLSQVSFANSTVLILGETGTGKELIARAIHNSSPRKDKLMVKVNCAVIPPSLIESELFGHEKGSFTGATERKIGKFELASNGTLFLDEIGEMPVDLQVKLLRAIQEKEIERIGGRATIRVNVRIIAATNRNLQKEVEEERFRRDLYYRLNVFPVTLPPLRERKEDIPLLVAHFIERFSKNTGKKINNISGRAMKELLAYHWPGNVRELEHLVERSVLMTEGSTIRQVYLPAPMRSNARNNAEDDFLKTYEENEREHIIRVLNKCNGKIFGPGGAAAILNLRVSTLNSKIKKLGIKKNRSFS